MTAGSVQTDSRKMMRSPGSRATRSTSFFLRALVVFVASWIPTFPPPVLSHVMRVSRHSSASPSRAEAAAAFVLSKKAALCDALTPVRDSSSRAFARRSCPTLNTLTSYSSQRRYFCSLLDCNTSGRCQSCRTGAVRGSSSTDQIALSSSTGAEQVSIQDYTSLETVVTHGNPHIATTSFWVE